MFVNRLASRIFHLWRNQLLDGMIGKTPGIQTNIGTSTLVGLTDLRVFVL